MVFAPGFGCDQTMWRFVTPAFEDRYRVVAFDHVGTGGSDVEAYDPDRYASLDGYADDVLQICDALDLPAVIFVGHSVSSMIGALAAIREPTRFDRLIMVGPSPATSTRATTSAGSAPTTSTGCSARSIATTWAGRGRSRRSSWATPTVRSSGTVDGQLLQERPRHREAVRPRDLHGRQPRRSAQSLDPDAGAAVRSGRDRPGARSAPTCTTSFPTANTCCYGRRGTVPPERARGNDRGDGDLPDGALRWGHRSPPRLRQREELYEEAPCGYSLDDARGRHRACERHLPAVDRVRARRGGGAQLHVPTQAPAAACTRDPPAPMLQMQGRMREIALEMVCADDARLPVLANAATTVTRVGAPVVRITILDASERREYERELLRTRNNVGAAPARHGGDGGLAGGRWRRRRGARRARGRARGRGVCPRPARPSRGPSRTPRSQRHGQPARRTLVRPGPRTRLDRGRGDLDRKRGVPRPGEPMPPLGTADGMLALVPLVARDRSIGLLAVTCAAPSFSVDERKSLGSHRRARGQAIDRATWRARAQERGARRLPRRGEPRDGREPDRRRSCAARDGSRRSYLADYAMRMPDRGPEPMAAAHRDHGLLQPLIELRRRTRLTAETPNTVARAIATGPAAAVSDILEVVYEDYTTEPEQLELLRRLAPRSSVGLPLRARGGVTVSAR